MQLLRVNLETNNVQFEDIPERWKKLGGRGLIARIALDEIPPQCEPLGPYNKLIWAPGLITGHLLSSCDRISIGGKSPLTGGIKEANAGGTTAAKMIWLGVAAIILEGGPPVDRSWKVLYLNNQGARIDSGDGLSGLGLKDTAGQLLARYNEKVGISAIGPAGERLYLSAGVANLDKDNNLTRISARGGVGAVMGSKHLKAIVFDQPRSNRPPVQDQNLFKEVSRRYIEALRKNPQTNETYPLYGTAGMVNMCNSFGGLPTRGFTTGTFEGAEQISGEAIYELNKIRGGDTTHACMPGCVINCSNIYVDPDGEPLVTPLEYETIGLMGSNLGIDDPDVIARLNGVANDMGMDTIEIGAALGIAAQAGYMEFGNGDQALELLGEIQADSPIGRIIASGVVQTGKILGIQRVPAVKGQAMPAYDPRAIKGTGITYATSPQGADHTCGLTIRNKIDHLAPEGQVEYSRSAQYKMAGYDTLGVCLMGGFGLSPDMVRDLINAKFGWKVSEEHLFDLGMETILLEREFNQRVGFTKADDRLPEWMTIEPLQSTKTVFDVPTEELDSIFDER
jgi:aldehyde:ferredoxin oxidoreductase